MAGDQHSESVNQSLPDQEQKDRKSVLRSKESHINSFVRFMNKTIRLVDVVWLNFEGAHVKYRTLNPDEFIDINTYVGHPWIFRDSQSGDKLMVHLNSDVYMPVGWQPEDGRPTRRLVLITIPVYTLKERCMQVIRELVPSKRTTELEIPNTLKDEILKKNLDERNGI